MKLGNLGTQGTKKTKELKKKKKTSMQCIVGKVYPVIGQ